MEDRFENRLNKDKIKFNTLNPVWDNKVEDGLNVFEMIDLLNKQDKLLKSKEYAYMEMNNMSNVLYDFMCMLNKLQANPTSEELLGMARDMLQMNGMVLE